MLENFSISSCNCLLGLTSSGLIQITFPFDAVTHAELRKIRPRGIWCGRNQGWQFPLSAAKSLQTQLGSRFLIDSDLSDWLVLLKKPLPKLPDHSLLIKKADFENSLDDGRIPLPHQRFGASWLLKQKAALLADEMGLGKTLTSLLAARAIYRSINVQVIVIAPVSLHSFWLEEAHFLGLPIVLYSWAKLPGDLPLQGAILIVDEAHFAQSLNTRRTQALLRLARHPRLRCIWLLSGTPVKNGRPVNLFPLLAALDHPLGFDQKAFEKRFCDGHWREVNGRRYWYNKGANDLEELSNDLKPYILSQKKAKLYSLPIKRRQIYQVRLDSIKTRGFNHRLSLVIDDYHDKVNKGEKCIEAESLVALTALRQISSEFKLPAVTSLVLELLAANQSVVLFSCFIKPLKLLQQRIGGQMLTGLQNLNDRKTIVKAFQEGKNNFLLATYGVGGLGFTLHKARHVILLERPWTPGEVDQAEDRCHRLGMEGPLVSYWFKLGLADQIVDRMIAKKERHINFIIQDKKIPLDNHSLSSILKNSLQ